MEHSITLVIFTFLSQLAIGAFATLFFLDIYKRNISDRSLRINLIAIFIVSIVAVIVSIFHLGQPFSAYKALLNFDDSWLTREIVFFPTFILFVLLYTFIGKTKGQKKLFGWLGILVGGTTIFSTAMIYKIPAVPAWNNGMTIVAFFVTALLLGPVFVQLLLALLDKKFVNLTTYTVIMAFLAIVLNILHISILKGGLPAAVESAIHLIGSPLFWVKIIALLLAFIISGYVVLKKKQLSISIVGLLFTCFLVAEFLGRLLFYSSGVHL